MGGARGPGHGVGAAVGGVEAGPPLPGAQQRVLLLLAEVEDGSAEQGARGQGAAPRALRTGPAAPVVAGLTVGVQPRGRGGAGPPTLDGGGGGVGVL